ncbi:hypothetical protein CE91St41_23960 [Oscillospiraceae bacterium]|nr:hypothetical protein CE91St40_13580 [Oscillospiraceae bacterium]BDF75507.1 hypothetical protein CE91St41_23960 [Oscillospiraceae bacterium]
MKSSAIPALAVALAVCLTACGGAPAPGGQALPSPSAAPAASPTPAPTPDPLWWEDVAPDDLPGEVADPRSVDLNSGDFYLLAELPDQNIALYGYGGSDGEAPSGVLIRRGEVLSHFDQRYLPPEEPLLPELWWGDFDGDGTEELAVKYLVENHAQQTIFELHIYEPDGEGWIDRPFTAEDYVEQLTAAVTATYEPLARRVVAEAGGFEASFYLEDLPAPDGDPPPLSFVTRVFYRYEDGHFVGVYGTGVMLKGMGGPLLFALTLGDVAYDGEGFTLENLELESTSGV